MVVHWRRCVGVVVLLSAVLAAPSASFGERQAKDKPLSYPAQVLLIRHAEKPPAGAASVDLSPQGKQRSVALPKLFQKSDSRPHPFPAPDFIFATQNSKHSHRPVETVKPLAKKLGLPIKADYPDDDFAKLGDEIFKNPHYAGKVVLICWHHGKMPELATALQAPGVPSKWKGQVFDRVWQITYDKGKASFTDRPQQLLPSDSGK